MTEEQAQQQAGANNALIEGQPFEYVIIKNYRNYSEFWEIIVIPSQYKEAFENASFEQSQAFGLVSLQVILQPGNFVTNFIAQATSNPILAPYLNL